MHPPDRHPKPVAVQDELQLPELSKATQGFDQGDGAVGTSAGESTASPTKRSETFNGFEAAFSSSFPLETENLASLLKPFGFKIGSVCVCVSYRMPWRRASVSQQAAALRLL